jgi:hypothetical protein
MRKHRIVTLDQVPEDQRAARCFYCYSPRSNRTGQVVAAVQVEPLGESIFFMICGNHMEVSPPTGVWQECKTL